MPNIMLPKIHCQGYSGGLNAAGRPDIDMYVYV